jgi:hypothetical protein
VANYKREILNQSINFFWTILCFAPVIWFWIKEGMDFYFFLFLATSLIVGTLPPKIFNRFTLSSSSNFYESLGVKHIRKFVQNGDFVKTMTKTQQHLVINGVSKARQYLKTIAMYERFHWVCFTFFFFTAIRCFFAGHLKLGLAITTANIVYNLGSILLQQYNKLRIKKITGRSNQ